MKQKSKRSTSRPRRGNQRGAETPATKASGIAGRPDVSSLETNPLARATAPEPRPPAGQERVKVRRWSVVYGSRKALDKDEPSDRIPKDLDAFDDEALEQFEAASQAAFAIIDSGAAGDKKSDFVIAISGHANPDHRPANGQPNESIAISINQIGS